MTHSINIKNSHILLTSYQDIETIIQPLKNFGVTSFVYQRNFQDGSEIRLTNQPAWTKHFFEQGYYQISGFEKAPAYYQSGVVVWSHLSHHQPILSEARRFNIDHGITLISKISNGCEFYFIGTTPSQLHVPNLLLNNLEFLKRFIVYFKEKAAPLLKIAATQRIIIPQKYKKVISKELAIPYGNAGNTLSLTRRETLCAQLLLKGLSARLIAKQLFISPRTVEKHIEHLKNKLNCRSKPELINALWILNIS